MGVDLRQLKDRAAERASRGQHRKAAELLAEVVRADPRDLEARGRLAEALRRAGDTAGALRTYRELVDRYAAQGQILKAIAVGKIVLEIEPGQPAMQEVMAALYARRAEEVRTGPAPREKTGIDLPLAPVEELDLRDAQPLAATLEPAEPRYAVRDPRAADWERFALDVQSNATPAPPPPAREPHLRRPAPVAPPPWIGPTGEHELTGALERTAVDLFELGATATGELDLGDAPLDPALLAPPPSGAALKLPRIPLFSDLPEDALAALAAQVTVREAAPGEVVLVEGEEGRSLFALAEGQVRVEKTSLHGTVVVGRLGAGAFFGEMALLSGARRGATVVAEERCELLEITAAALESVIAVHPPVGTALVRFCRARLLANALATSAIFAPLDEAERRALASRLRAVQRRPGEVVLREGTRPDGWYVVLTGELDVLRGAAPGAVQDGLVTRLTEGDVVGEVSALAGVPASTTVVARSRALLLELPLAELDRLASAHPSVLASLRV